LTRVREHTGRRGLGAGLGRGREALAGLRWYAALPAGAGALLLAAGVFLLTTGHHARPLAAGCGLVNCSASLPPAVVAAHAQGGPSGRPAATRPAAGRPVAAGPPRMRLRARSAPTTAPQAGATSAPAPAATSSPAPSAPPSPPAGAATVTYALDQRWPGGFMGHFTIVNNGSAPVSGWVLAAALPGDHIDSVWNASYRSDGTTLTLTPAPWLPDIPPGASQSAYFTASGTTAWPTACTFNSQSCGG
jgi:hypothetical protein